MTSKEWTELRALVDERCLLLKDEPIRLSTGALSKYYFDCKTVTLEGRALSLIADVYLEKIRELPIAPTAIGGLTMGADFITAAVAMRASERGETITHGSIVRKEAKRHGTMNKIENDLGPGTKIVVVDDVITTGKSTRLACEEFVKSGYEIVGIIALVDREEGGKKALEDQFGKVVTSIFKRSDFPRLCEDANIRRNQDSDQRRQASGTARVVNLKSGGTLTLTASLDLFQLSPSDRTFVFDLIDKLDTYEKESEEGMTEEPPA